MLSLKLVRGIENADSVRPVVHIPPDQARFVIGRDPACDWCIADKQLALSARHCEVVLIEGRHVLRDTSTNGTFLNGSPQRLPADHVLRHGDRIALGNYRVEVSIVSDAAAVASKAPAASPAPALRRGGDPAAMVGSDWERAAAHAGAPAADVKTGFTRISKPPPKEVLDQVLAAAGPRVESQVATESPVPVREPVYRAPPGSQDILQRLAGGLNVPVEALGSTDPALAAERVAKLLRRAVLALHKQLADQAQQLNSMGSRAPLSIGRGEAAPIRMAPGPDAAVAALLAARGDADAMIMMAVKELGQHSQRLLAAFTAANTRLADQLAPAALERSAGSDDPARLWKFYSSVWTALGTGVGKPWSEGFGATAAAYLATAYDEKLADATAADKPTRP
jgi:type VI secretion system protein ImpI